MALNEKELEKIKNRFENQNKIIMNLYKKSKNKALLDLLYLKTDDIAQVSKEFDLSEEIAAELIRKNKQFGEKKEEDSVSDALFEMFDENRELYNRAFEIVSSSGKANAEELQKSLYISEEKAQQLLNLMKERGDIASDSETSETSENSENDFCEEKSNLFDNSDDFDCDNSDDEKTDDKKDSCKDEDFNIFKESFPEKIIEALCFFGDVIQDTSEKICDALDESIERVNNFDFED